MTGITFHNDQGESMPAGTPFIDRLRAVLQQRVHQPVAAPDGALASTAKKYYGLNQKWNIGIGGLSASYFNAPASASGSELAQEAFGQGDADGLAARDGLGRRHGGHRHVQAAVPGARDQAGDGHAAAATTDADLKQMMRAVVTSGTAAGLGFGPTVYAKTGTADIQNQGKPNSWLVAFDPSKDVAVGCLVLDAGYGAQFAGPEVVSFLNAY